MYATLIIYVNILSIRIMYVPTYLVLFVYLIEIKTRRFLMICYNYVLQYMYMT